MAAATTRTRRASTAKPDEKRFLRVYAPDGDFILEVPASAKVTFGYFNPSSHKWEGEGQGRSRGFDGYGSNNVARQTALRIYDGVVSEKNQIAVFLGVKGFRFDDLKLTKLQERVTIIRNFDDDPSTGVTEDNVRQQKQLVAVQDDEIAF